ncbi:MAG: FHA domain-containing protein [Holophaga sp.]|nr:FHA domain-containing protein [Holophaga sp.]
MAKLLVQEGNGAREFELVDLEVNIGRELDNTLRLADPSISRHHAVIRLGPAGYEIQDLQSSNGVLLNGNRVPSGPLQDGDRITLGQMQLTFVDPQAPAGGGSPRGTVRMDPAAMARLWAEAPAGPPQPEAQAPFPAPALALAAPAVRPGPPFLHRFLPAIPDPAVPLRTPDGAVVRAEFGTRFLACLIDVSPMLALSGVALAATLGPAPGLGCAFASLQLVLLVGYLILLPLYWMRLGASPGKNIMKLRVVPEGDPSGHLDLGGSILRLFGYLANTAISLVLRDLIVRGLPPSGPQGTAAQMLPYLLSLVFVLPYLAILGKERRALEDRFSHSLVIRVDR